LLQRAHDLDSQNPEIGYHLAVALDANGKRVEAKTLLMSVLQANPKFDGVEDAKQLVARW
jgi:thioredoxin-like negative regulator of GroEL